MCIEGNMLRALWVLLFLFSGNVKASRYDIDEIPEAPHVLFLRLTTQDIAAQSRKEEIDEFRDLILVFSEEDNLAYRLAAHQILINKKYFLREDYLFFESKVAIKLLEEVYRQDPDGNDYDDLLALSNAMVYCFYNSQNLNINFENQEVINASLFFLYTLENAPLEHDGDIFLNLLAISEMALENILELNMMEKRCLDVLLKIVQLDTDPKNIEVGVFFNEYYTASSKMLSVLQTHIRLECNEDNSKMVSSIKSEL